MKLIQWMMAIAGLILITACSSGPERVNYPVPEPVREYSNWDEVFEHPADIQIEIWNTGFIECPSKGLYNHKYPDAPVLEKTMLVPVPVYYLSYSDGRGVLVDSGLDSALTMGKLTHVKGLLKSFIIPPVEKRNSRTAADYLEAESLPLDTLLLTHMHFDHTGGLADLSGDFRVLSGKGEKPIEVPALFRATHMDKLDQLEEIDYSQAGPMYPFDHVVDLYGDGSIFALSTPGHTSGHSSYLVNSRDGVYLIAGDELNIRENREYAVPPGGFSSDLDMAEESFFKIMEFLELYPQVTLLMGHDIQ